MLSVLLSHTVLSEMYQEKLVTEDDVERMKEETWHLFDRLVHLNVSARKLRG